MDWFDPKTWGVLNPIRETPSPSQIKAERRDAIKDAVNLLVNDSYGAALKAGWHHDLHTGEPKDHNVGEMLMLMVSEIVEGFEGYRKGLMDDKLPHRSMIEVEFADVLIRLLDTAGEMHLDLAGAYVEKRAFNDTRKDHTREARLATGGKKF